jgi:hypothetical protein
VIAEQFVAAAWIRRVPDDALLDPISGACTS